MPHDELDPEITVALIVTKTARNEDGIARLRDQLTELGLEPGTPGLATLSARLPVSRFDELFSVEPENVEPVDPGRDDMGTPGGRVVSEPLPIPPELAELVTHISIVPPATRLTKQEEE